MQQPLELDLSLFHFSGEKKGKQNQQQPPSKTIIQERPPSSKRNQQQPTTKPSSRIKTPIFEANPATTNNQTIIQNKDPHLPSILLPPPLPTPSRLTHQTTPTDAVSRKGLVVLVKRRRRLLQTLRHRDKDRWLATTETLGLRQRPDAPPATTSEWGEARRERRRDRGRRRRRDEEAGRRRR